MNNPNDKVIQTQPNLCKACFACLRACPVKAIKITEGHAQIIDEKCISCGICAQACKQGAHTISSEIESVGSLLEKSNTVAILAPEAPASFYPSTVSQLKSALLNLGFATIEDTVLAEELIADRLLQYWRTSSRLPIIRSSCPVIVEFIIKYYPDFRSNLIPLVSPMVIQARLVKALYPEEIAVVYIASCPARKAEAEEVGEDFIDAVLTFDQLKSLLVRRRINLNGAAEIELQNSKPFLVRTVSVTGGFPREIVASRTLMDKDVSIVRGVDSLAQLLDAIKKGDVKPSLIDALACGSCLEGPGFDSELSLFAKKRIIETSYMEESKRAPSRISYNDICRLLPQIKEDRSFAARKLDLSLPSEDELRTILALAEKDNADGILDCGACGYETCLDNAVAVYRGLADWSSCSPFQRKAFLKIIKELEETAVTDGLTQLANHRHFSERLAIEVKRARRYNSSLSLIMIDIDYFKLINDRYGHLAGDDVLKNVARIIKENVRESDIPARYGGDEFALILPETGIMQAFTVAEKLRTKVEGYVFTSQDVHQTAKLTTSIGVAMLTPDVKEAPQLIEKADQAMYKAKQDGRNKTYMAAETSA
jgi:diguanylate cyclase (GGDEF)-like protein